MSEGLSRVRTRQKQYKGEGQASVKDKKHRNRAVSSSPAEAPVPVPGNLSRKARHSGSGSRRTVQPEQPAKDQEGTPSRTDTYPSERIRLSKIFVNSLIVMFVALVVSLVVWGVKGAPPLDTLW
ncbi:hypothetical protein C2I18_02020 [Paenibacillus sp. PK3_47]|uniref:hypothetical protein n=1 Tax=Paenibacillus sp. PK3_47 TaxID=2072642 RepID=UPI00201D5585|nr:hypothetical protein [Paenibacillus sp. PK3_47]UQZ32435.1 hypothetical protein C2I18_02020 [Paenibacillus sp. PK3_47]